MLRHRLTRLIVALSLTGFPAAALAQDNAGDEQYRDPLPPQQKAKKRSSTRQGSTPAPARQQSAAPAQSVGAAPTEGTSPSASSKTGGGEHQLARTGFDLRAIVAIGLALLLAGLALIRLSRRPAPR